MQSLYYTLQEYHPLLLLFKERKVAKLTVYDTIKSYKKLGNNKDCFRTAQPRTAHTSKKIKAMWERIRRNQQRTMRMMAESLRISLNFMLSIVKKDSLNIFEILSLALIKI